MNVYSALVPIAAATGVAEQITSLNPKFELFDAKPNPSNGATQLGFRLENASKVVFEIIDLTGKSRAILFNGIGNAGENYITLPDGLLTNGTYFYKLTTDYGYSLKSLIILK